MTEPKKTPIPFRYPGGKYYALGLLSPFWNSIKHDEYREPFVGGGSVFFTKMKSEFNVLNDIDTELITTYQVLSNKEKQKELLSKINNEVATKERWREVFEFVPKTDVEVAYKYYYLNRTSFSGKLQSAAWGYREKRSLPPERWHERIIPCGEKLDNVLLTNQDFERIIDMPAQGNNVLMFVDPPYFGPAKKKHYRNGFNLEDHFRLMESLKKTNHKFFLTYDDVSEIREIYKWANIYEASFFYRVENSGVMNGVRKKGCELIITNYEPLKQINLFDN